MPSKAATRAFVVEDATDEGAALGRLRGALGVAAFRGRGVNRARGTGGGSSSLPSSSRSSGDCATDGGLAAADASSPLKIAAARAARRSSSRLRLSVNVPGARAGLAGRRRSGEPFAAASGLRRSAGVAGGPSLSSSSVSALLKRPARPWARRAAAATLVGEGLRGFGLPGGRARSLARRLARFQASPGRVAGGPVVRLARTARAPAPGDLLARLGVRDGIFCCCSRASSNASKRSTPEQYYARVDAVRPPTDRSKAVTTVCNTPERPRLTPEALA